MPGGESMKALTVCEPYASLIACGFKTYETRSWATKYRGPLIIHAGKSKKYMRKSAELGLPEVDPKYGMIIAVGELVAVHRITPEFMAEITDAEKAMGFYTPGRYAWEIRNIVQVDPFKARGQLGIWNWKGE